MMGLKLLNSKEEGEETHKSTRMDDFLGSNRVIIILLCLSIFTSAIVFTNLIISSVSVSNMSSLGATPLQANANFQTLILNNQIPIELDLYGAKCNIDIGTKKVTYFEANSTKELLTGRIANSVDYLYYKQIKYDSNKKRIEFNSGQSRAANLELQIRTSYHSDDEITCNNYNWKIIESNKPSAPQEFEDCFDLGSAKWFGGSETATQQFWPINEQDFNGYKPYLSGVFASASAVLERYWLSSNGFAIAVDYESPLFVLKNKTNICLMGASREPYNEKKLASLNYDICSINSGGENYLNKLHLFMINKYFSKPNGVPDELMFKSPIWSTWAVYKKFINEQKVEEFAQEILDNKYTHSQLEIDDKWQTEYGDFTFDTFKFSNMENFIGRLNQLGFRTTLWIHPFVNVGAKNFLEWAFKLYTVRASDGIRPSFTSWWDGIASFILDATNENATSYFVNELEKIRATTGINSFKFDAGEFEWLPKNGYLENASETPEQYCSSYARMAARLGSMIEIRVGCRTQDLPVFVRMIDRDSKWGFDNGLKSVLTTTLTFSILGYPYVLPDMIGGNAYIFIDNNIDFNTTEIAYPDDQLFIRWTQLNAFLPAMQFSIPPWHYNNRSSLPVNSICQKYVELHETLVFPKLKQYAEIANATGEPIIRPIWWLDNSDEYTYTVNDEFLVGNDILVAPILDENTYEREIYLPKGNWQYSNSNGEVQTYTGPIMLKNFTAPIDIIPYFIKLD